jgi:transposase
MGKRRKKKARRSASEGRRTGRYNAEEKAEILGQIDTGRTQAEVAKQYGVHPVTVCRWLKRREAAKATGAGSGESGLVAQSTRPHHSPSPVCVAHRQLTIEVKGAHPEMGPAQIRNQLRRFHGISLSHKTIGKILRDAGFKLEKRVGDEEEAVIERFEMTRPNELWTMDIKTFYIHDLKVYLADIIDDYSRFIVGHGLFKETSTDAVSNVVLEAIQRHGKPERILTDRGSEFHAWRGVSAFTRFLENEGVEHSLARPHHPETCGKIEAVHRTLEK